MKFALPQEYPLARGDRTCYTSQHDYLLPGVRFQSGFSPASGLLLPSLLIRPMFLVKGRYFSIYGTIQACFAIAINAGVRTS